MKCPVCAVALDAPVAACPMCGVPLRRDGGAFVAVMPVIRPGEALVSRDFTEHALPGQTHRVWSRLDGSSATAHPHGLVVATQSAEVFCEDWLRARDVCVRASLGALDDASSLGIVARREPIDGARTFYALDVLPAARKARLARCFSTKKETGVTPLVDFTRCDAIRGGGALEELELRAQGTALEAWVNGHRFAALHDPVLGIGFVGIRIERRDAKAAWTRVLLRGFEARQVTP